MNLTKLQITALFGCAAFMLLSAPRTCAATPGPQPAGFGQDRDDWQRPPDAWNDVQRRGFHDGMEGARKDVDNHRRPDVNNREEYRNPSVPPQAAQSLPRGLSAWIRRCHVAYHERTACTDARTRTAVGCSAE